MDTSIISTPWDSRIFKINTYQITYISDNSFEQSINKVISSKQFGHYTIKVNPLCSKGLLHSLGFYYCDSLLEPFCLRENFVAYFDQAISVTQDINFEEIKDICNDAFSHGRFHRDFNIARRLANERYNQWLQDLWDENQVWALMHNDELAGFFGFSGNQILLHALKESFRGRNLSKFFWSAACQRIFERGETELISSISACNLSVLNLYISLGFKFRNPVDVYHWLYQE
jgi:hypothetical protein